MSNNIKSKIIDLICVIFLALLAIYNFYIALLVLIFLLIKHTASLENNKYLIDINKNNIDKDFFAYLIIRDSKIIFANKKALEIKNFIQGKEIFEYLNNLDIKSKKQKAIINNQLFDIYIDSKKNYAVLYLIKNHEENPQTNSTAVGLIMLDNFEEVTQTVEDIKKPLIKALIDRKLSAFALDLGGIVKKFEHDKYILICSDSKLIYFKDKNFYLLEQIRKIDMGNESPITLSIGIGQAGKTLNQSMEYARAALDLALGRGGDQVLIKDPDRFYFFGNKQAEINSNTKVRARVKTYVFKELIDEASNVIVMGHKNPDPDCLGAAIGVYKFALSQDKQCKIILNKISESIKPIYKKIILEPEYQKDIFIKNNEALDFFNDSSLIVIVDTHRLELLECPELVKNSSHVVVFDHHRKNAEFINNTVMNYYEPYASSTAELITEMLQIKNDAKITPIDADALLAGITIDTKNFTFKTGVKTYNAAAYLRRKGADAVRLKKLFRDSIETYKIKISAINNMEIFNRDNKDIAIAICKNDIDNLITEPTLIIAETADEILNIKDISASFVLCECPNENKVLISARSMGDINVQIIMERLNGGGHFTSAGAQLKKISIEDAIIKLKKAIEDILD